MVLHTFDGYHWIYWVGPALGALLAVGLYRLIKALEYETANPGADFDRGTAEVFYPDEDPSAARRPHHASSYDGAVDAQVTPPAPLATVAPSQRRSSEIKQHSRLHSTAGQTNSVYSTSPDNHSGNAFEGAGYRKSPEAEEGTL